MMKNGSFYKLIVWTFISVFFTSVLYGVENFDGEFVADIDYDGEPEMVQWNKFATTDMGDYYQLRVIDDNGQIIWEGSKEKNEANPYIFSALHFGICVPEFLGDVDMDGHMELLAPEPQGDVSPTVYRRLRWNGKGFDVLPSRTLIATRDAPENFSWHKETEGTGIWISRFYAIGSQNGSVRVDVMAYDGGANAHMGTALLKFNRKGAHVITWIKKLKLSTTKQSMPPPGKERNAYTARLSQRDHFNSRGIALSTVKDILRQDRANYYRYGGDPEDQADLWFRTLYERKRIEKLRILPVGTDWQNLSRKILQGTPRVEIRVEGGTLHVHLLP